MCLIGTETLTVITCGECGIMFAMPETYRLERKKDGQGWHCPNGHVRVYRESDVDKYKGLLEKEQREAARLREAKVAAERAQQRAEKSLTRLKKRTAAGTCPCCNRTFKQLAAHMESKHADFKELQGLTPRKQLTEGIQ